MIRNVARSCSAATPSRQRYSSRSAASWREGSAFAPLTRRKASVPAPPSGGPVQRSSSSRVNSSSAQGRRSSAARRAQRFSQGRQVLRVGGGVREHGGWQRSARPVGLLVLLGELHPHVLFEQRREPHGGL